jgi:hypothetical protein
MKRNRFLLGVAGIAVAASAAAVAAGVGFGGPPTPVLSGGGIAALESPATSADALPARVLQLPFARHFADPAAARLALRDAERTVYVVPGRDTSLCLVVVEANGGIGLNCAGRSVLRSGAVWQGTGNDDGSTDIVGVVGDGVAYVQPENGERVAVKDNVFTIDGATGRTIVFTTDEGVEANFDLGDMNRTK